MALKCKELSINMQADNAYCLTTLFLPARRRIVLKKSYMGSCFPGGHMRSLASAFFTLFFLTLSFFGSVACVFADTGGLHSVNDSARTLNITEYPADTTRSGFLLNLLAIL